MPILGGVSSIRIFFVVIYIFLLLLIERYLIIILYNRDIHRIAFTKKDECVQSKESKPNII